MPKLTKKDTRTTVNWRHSGVFLFNFDHNLFLASCSTVSYVNFELVSAYSRPLLSATIAPNLKPWVLKKIFSLEMIKNDICLGGASKQNAFFHKMCPKKMHPCPQCLE